MRNSASVKLAHCGVAVMAKASHPGRTKTRLSPPLTHTEAASFNTAFIQDIADNLSAAAALESISGYMAYGPPGEDGFFREIVPPAIGLFETWAPNFGDCLQHALAKQFESGHKAACALNSDSPTLPVSLLVEAARLLASPGDRAVLGPSTDGGYYLLGVKQMHRRLFEDISWSTEHVAAQTLERAREIGLDVAILPEWYDIDDKAALQVFAAEVLDGAPFDPRLKSSAASHSTALMRQLMATGDFPARIGYQLALEEAVS